MPEFSHEDIKNAILHAGEATDQAVTPVDDAKTPIIVDIPEAPHTPYEGVVGSEPTEDERVGFRAAKDQVHTRHRNRTTVPSAQPERSRHRTVIAGGTVVGLLLAAAGGFMAFRGQGDNNTEHTDTKPSASSSAEPSETPKPVETLQDYAVTTDKYPTAEAASPQLVLLEDTYMNSEEAHPIILQAILGDNIHATEKTSDLANDMEVSRVAIQVAKHRMLVGNNKLGEFSLSFDPDGTNDSGQAPIANASYAVDGTAHYVSNYDEPPYYDYNFDWDQPYRLLLSYDEDGVWHVVEQVSTGERIPTASSE